MAPHKSTRYTVTNNSNACKISILPHTPVTIHINRSYLNVQLSNFNGELSCNPYGYSSSVYTTHLPIKLKKKIRNAAEQECFYSNFVLSQLMQHIAKPFFIVGNIIMHFLLHCHSENDASNRCFDSNRNVLKFCL